MPGQLHWPQPEVPAASWRRLAFHLPQLQLRMIMIGSVANKQQVKGKN